MNNFYAVPYYIAIGLAIGTIVVFFLPLRFSLLNRCSAAGTIALVIGWLIYLVRQIGGF